VEDGPTSVAAKRQTLLRALPSVDELLQRPSLRPLLSAHPRPLAVAAVRKALADARARALAGDDAPFAEDEVHAALRSLARPRLTPVHNATGVVLHTNLGRAPLAPRAVERVAQVAGGYCNLEYDLEAGARGSRYAPVVDLLCGLTSAQSALVVNNNAAAVLLVLAALAQGREVIVSRGELVEIGGGFRIPDVMRQSGARLVEVGTTNRTRLSDYEDALTAETGLLLKVHRSNFAQVGFTEDVDTSSLVALGRRHGVPVFEDLGSGCLLPLEVPGLTPEPTVRSVVERGADVVSFSGDKLLGGPQAGIIVGREDLVDRVRRHPLNRALRVDKLTVAALEATLELYRDGRAEEIPGLAMLRQPPDGLRQRAEALRECLAREGVGADVVQTCAQVGGGAMPLAEPVSYACALHHPEPVRLQQLLRRAAVPVVGRISQERLLLDVRCLGPQALAAVARAVAGCLQGPEGSTR
jgi:L-seryl-tRNA(Ser) seleniumtransferase